VPNTFAMISDVIWKKDNGIMREVKFTFVKSESDEK
jgi:hypothetical protein